MPFLELAALTLSLDIIKMKSAMHESCACRFSSMKTLSIPKLTPLTRHASVNSSLVQRKRSGCKSLVRAVPGEQICRWYSTHNSALGWYQDTCPRLWARGYANTCRSLLYKMSCAWKPTFDSATLQSHLAACLCHLSDPSVVGFSRSLHLPTG